MTVPIWLHNIETCEWKRVRTVNTNQSPFTGQIYQSRYPDARWQARISYAEMTRAEAAPLLAAIAAQRDGVGTFGLFDPDFAVPQSGFTGFGSTTAVPTPGSFLINANMFPPATLICRAGDKMWCNYGSGVYRMAEVLVDHVTDASGNAEITIDEPFASPPPIGFGIGFNWIVEAARVPMRLVSHERQSLPGARFRISIVAEERV